MKMTSSRTTTSRLRFIFTATTMPWKVSSHIVECFCGPYEFMCSQRASDPSRTFVFTIRSNRGVKIMATREVEKSCSTSEMSSS